MAMAKDNINQFTIGVEEEYMVLDPSTKELKKPSASYCQRRPKKI